MKYIINTNMSKEQCIEYTKENLPKLGNYRKAKFFGRVNNKGFKISVNGSTEYFIRQNIARPVNVGRFEETENGVVIHVTQMISLPFFAMCLMTFLFLLFTLLTIILDGIGESNVEIIKTEGITSLFFLLFTLIMIGIFKGYERKDMEEVTKIYSGK